MAHLALSLLGRFQATLDGQPVEGLHSDRLRALLAYLAVTGREHQREHVAALLWPGRSDTEALAALRFSVSNLHEALRDRHALSPFVVVTRTTVHFNPASDHWLDIAEFGGLADRLDVAGLERAASLYRGPFLEGVSVDDSAAFEDWVLLTGEELLRRALSALGRLTHLQIERGAYIEAERWARRQIDSEPYREHAHRQLMMALALRGERASALAHYQDWRTLLAAELECEPEDETRALYAQIRDGSLPRPWSASTTVDAAAVAASPAQVGPVRFVAREQELARLDGLLERALAGQGGLALISGEAGSGKTALLGAFARRAAQAYPDLIVLRGSSNAHGGAGDAYLPFREILQTLAGDVEGKRAGGTLSPEQARRVWEALPAVGAALVEHGPDLIDTFVPGEALLRRAEGFFSPLGAARWQALLREIIRNSGEGAAPAPGSGLDVVALQPDLFAQVTLVLHTVSAGRPLLLVIDDLQWAGAGTAALLFHLGRRLEGSRMLLACAYRPEALDNGDGEQASALSVGAVLSELTRQWGDVLIDLDQTDGRTFVEAYIDSEPNRLGTDFRRALYGQTEGHPLFTVELLRRLERQGALVRDDGGRWIEAAKPDWTRCPPQVEAVIALHMAGLPEEDRALLQAASVQGEQFAAEVAARVLGLSEESVVRRLSGRLRTRHRLVEAVSLDRLASSGQRLSHYRFRHALLQQSAYGSLDAVARAWQHEATGRALEEVYTAQEERRQAHAPTLARHFEEAGLPLDAARYRLEAGQWAARLAVFDEAVAHLEQGLALLEGVNASRERLRLETDLWMAMADPVLLQKGWQAPDLGRALKRLADLVDYPELQGDPLHIAALSTLALQTTWLADPVRGHRVGEQLMQIAQDGDPQSLALAHWVLGHSLWTQGRFVSARDHLERALALYDLGAGRTLSPVMGADPGVMGRSLLGVAQWFLGFADQGRASLEEACEEAEAIGHSPTVVFAHMMAALIYSLLGLDPDSVAVHLAVARPLGECSAFYNDFEQMLAAQGLGGDSQGGSTGRAGLDAGYGRPARSASEVGSFAQVGGQGMGGASLLLLHARTLARDGLFEAALQTVDQNMAWMARTGARAMEADTWRMRGELLLAADGRRRTTDDGHWGEDETKNASSTVHRPSSAREAEACFERALEISRARGTRWLELRAAVSLARLWQAQGRRDEARELLAGVYGWFTEGFDTVDLVEAKALLQELQ